MNRSREFKKSREEETQGLIENETFELLSVADVAKETPIFGSRLIDTIKAIDSGTRYKSQFVDHNYGGKKATTIGTKALTVQQFTERLMPSLVVSLESLSCRARDITQAYTQSATSL